MTTYRLKLLNGLKIHHSFHVEPFNENQYPTKV